MPARTDLVRDERIVADLLLARRGTAYFTRLVNELSDEDLYRPSGLPGWTRAHVLAHIGYNARALSNVVAHAHLGENVDMYPSRVYRDNQIDFGATLNPTALRNLHFHALVHLNVEWRDLPEESWGQEFTTLTGAQVAVAKTPWMRAREVWVHAVDLGNGGRFRQFPIPVIERIFREAVERVDPANAGAEGEAHVTVVPLDRPELASQLGAASGADKGPGALTVEGTLADLTQWITGRGALDLKAFSTDESGKHRISVPLPTLGSWLG